MTSLYPFSGASTIADKTILRFAAVNGMSDYHIEIQDENSTPVFKTEVKTARVPVPPQLLKPGARYRWQVRAAGTIGPNAAGEATFETLSAENLDRRTALQAALRNTQDAASLGLLAEIDFALGLFDEALEGLTAAVALRPDDRVLRLELQKAQQLMKERRD